MRVHYFTDLLPARVVELALHALCFFCRDECELTILLMEVNDFRMLRFAGRYFNIFTFDSCTLRFHVDISSIFVLLFYYTVFGFTLLQVTRVFNYFST